MNSWYSKQFSHARNEIDFRRRISQSFDVFTAINGVDHNVAVFNRYDSEDDITTVFFTPKCQRVAEIFGAEPCDKPKWDGNFSLLIGDIKSKKTFFSDYE